ncbi:hypothetical protein GYMLUDRAFT_788375 [Collybiopsis luxurians FD-317 M1]|nr:hypothetical protein GYMLUDRAFT_788375 [Collybiopsis luxurians FD-317 M1]
MSSSFDTPQNPSSASFRSNPSMAGLKDGIVLEQQSLSPRRLHAAFDALKWLCVVSHISLIILLASFAFRRPDKTDHSLITFSHPSYLITDDDSDLSGYFFLSAISITYGGIVVGWTAVLTLITQKLALRRQLNLLTSLTSTHDANEAWMGTGSAVMGLLKLRQLGLRAALNPIILPLAYLGAISSLHSVAMEMLDLAPVPENTTVSFSSTGIPDFSGYGSHNILTGSSALLTMQSLDGLDFTGLAPDGTGIIYDIPNPVEIKKVPSYVDIWVNATRFDVSCGSLSGAVESTDNGTTFVFSPEIDIPTSLSSTIIDLPIIISQRSLLIRPAPWGAEFPDANDPRALWPSSILIFSTVDIQDSSNNTVNTVPVNPPMTYPQFNSTATSTTSQVAVLACNLTVDQYSNKALIDPFDNGLLHLKGEGNKTSAQLNSFPVTTRPSLYTNVSQAAEDALISIWSLLPISATSPMDGLLQSYCLDNISNNFTDCGTLFEAEQFVMESLNIFPDFLLPDNVTSSQSIQLQDLENTLSRMTAIEFWAESEGNNLKFANTLSNAITGSSASSFVTHNNSVEFQQDRLVLVLDRRNLFVALALAIFLLAVASPCVLDKNNVKIDSVGLLQMVWLANYHPEMRQSIAKLENPSIEELRKEGLRVKRVLAKHPLDQPPEALELF